MTGEIEQKMSVIEKRSGLGGLAGHSALERGLLALQQLGAELNSLQAQQEQLDDIVSSLAGGRLPSALVASPTLLAQLVRVETALPPNFSLLYPRSVLRRF